MRAFIALELPAEFRSEVAAISRVLARTCRGRFLPYENMHVTLAFLGEIDEREAAAVVSVLDKACTEAHEPCTNAGLAGANSHQACTNSGPAGTNSHQAGTNADPAGAYAPLASTNSHEASTSCPQSHTNLSPILLIPNGLGKFGKSSDATLWMGLKQTSEFNTLVTRLREGLVSHNIDFDEKPFLAHITLGRRVHLPKGELPELPFPAPARATNVTLFKSTLSSTGASYKPLYTIEL